MTPPFVQTLIRFALRTLTGLVLTMAIGAGLYMLFSYNYAYSKGETVGYVQKLSYKGWICKTWEGQQVRALSEVPTVPEKFEFTVRDVKVAEEINAHIGQKVVMQYEQHKGLPSCFGDTEHFVVAVHPVSTD
jgi:hypothetical protein